MMRRIIRTAAATLAVAGALGVGYVLTLQAVPQVSAVNDLNLNFIQTYDLAY
jgi:hypothetical protein